MNKSSPTKKIYLDSLIQRTDIASGRELATITKTASKKKDNEGSKPNISKMFVENSDIKEFVPDSIEKNDNVEKTMTKQKS